MWSMSLDTSENEFPGFGPGVLGRSFTEREFLLLSRQGNYPMARGRSPGERYRRVVESPAVFVQGCEEMPCCAAEWQCFGTSLA